MIDDGNDRNNEEKKEQEEPEIDPNWMDHIEKGGKIGKPRESEEKDSNS